MNILQKIRNGITYVDGGAGTLLQSWGLQAGELPEMWNLTNPDKIIDNSGVLVYNKEKNF